MGAISAVFLILITIFFPPIGVWAVAGYLFINICLTLLGFLPGHIHAFYLEYIYYDRREQAREGRFATGPAPGIYSDNVQTGGQGYGTMGRAA
ncbi:uncharacterized protein BKA55DRAFT_684578 [Fusarium redolens]|uniref:Plasma membrane proteolipid 3 n=1 Tax=Fusarium redolens TaxID=48865 RepID=A0A9P9KRQ4_FUSRE|nr:uncharacterized protein BKA55DRAFT_684578 [Fusarium redolens]KAH7267311.1 hypothetical protein BKA55DRAFT_684578 [Fusarium redolens]